MVALLVGGGVVTAFVILDEDAPMVPEAVPTSTRPTPASSPPGPVAPEPEPPAGANEPEAILQDVTYCNNDGVDLELDFFRPDVATATPLVVYVHGGGWTGGNKGQIQHVAAFEPMLEAGYSIASVNYRLAPDYPFPAPLIDVKCAVRHVRANADSYGIDPDRIGVAGFSAGAQLALLVGVTEPGDGFDLGQYSEVSSAVGAVIEFSGPGDITSLSAARPEIVRVAFGDFPEALVAASPVSYLDADDPPVLIFHGEQDRTVPVKQSMMLDESLSEAGIEHSTIIAPGGTHRLPSDPADTATILDFLDRHVA